MTLPEVFTALARAPAEVALEDLPALLGRLVEAEERARLRLRNEGAPPAGNEKPGEEGERWLTPEQAAGIAGIPVKRLYEWARGKRWASRPSRKCLRIAESRFRTWLAAST
jgi:hypothetical protein